MQYIIDSNNIVIATHDDSQNVIAKYPGCRSVISDKSYDLGTVIPAVEIPVEAIRLDALKLKRILEDLGLWELLADALEQTDAMTDLLLSGGVIRTDDPVYCDMLERLQPLIAEAELDINEILAACRM